MVSVSDLLKQKKVTKVPQDVTKVCHESKVTKVTKPAGQAHSKPKMGRPCVGDRPMTATERKRRQRARSKDAG